MMYANFSKTLILFLKLVNTRFRFIKTTNTNPVTKSTRTNGFKISVF